MNLYFKICEDLNGKIIFGKYIPYEQINISCLVDIEGKDLAMILIEDIDQLYVEDIA